MTAKPLHVRLTPPASLAVQKTAKAERRSLNSAASVLIERSGEARPKVKGKK